MTFTGMFKLKETLQAHITSSPKVVVVIGASFTGKTYACQTVFSDLGITPISFDYDSLREGNHKDSLQIVKNASRSRWMGKTLGTFLFCDALESYQNQGTILTFLKEALSLHKIPSVVTCDSSITIPKHDMIERVWWNEPRYHQDDWKGDTVESTPRDMFIRMTSSRTSRERAVEVFSGDPFLLSHYYHDEYLESSKMTLPGAQRSADALSLYDVIQYKTTCAGDIFIPSIRNSPGVFPKGWFPKTLSKQSKITRNQQECSNLRLRFPTLEDTLLVFQFKKGRGWYYKTPEFLQHFVGKISGETLQRAQELLGMTPMTQKEVGDFKNLMIVPVKPQKKPEPTKSTKSPANPRTVPTEPRTVPTEPRTTPPYHLFASLMISKIT